MKVGKKYRVTKELGKDISGKRLREYVYASTETEAKKILAEFEYTKNKGLLVQTDAITVVEMSSVWMDNYVAYNCEETTKYAYQNIIKHISNTIGAIKLQELSPQHIQHYYKLLMDKKGLSPNTVHKHHACLRKMLDYALKQQYVYRNVADAVSLPKRVRYEATVYNKEQLGELLLAVKGTKLEVPIFLAGYLGLRREEIVGLKWKYVDFDGHCIRIEEVRTAAGSKTVIKGPKSDSSRRQLYMTKDLEDLLLKCKAQQEENKMIFGREYEDTGYVVANVNGRPYRVNSLSEHFSDFIKKNNFVKLRLHDLRHTFCSILYNEGVDLKAISETAGHGDINITNKIYTHLFDKTHKETLSVMGDVLRIK